jgi:hypothetical protein
MNDDDHRRLYRRVLNLFRSREQEQPSSQPQREALIDLLVWTMFADRHVALPEQAFIAEQADGLPWDSPRPVELYIDKAVRRTREVLGDEAAEASHLEAIATRLADPQMKRAALSACEELIGVDGERAPSELTHLERVRVKLGVEV